MPLKTYPAEIKNSPAYDFVEEFIKQTYTYTNRYGGMKPDGHLAPWDEVLRRLDLARGTMKHAPTEKHVAAALEEWRRHRALCAEVDIINSLAFSNYSNALDDFLIALTGEVNPLHKAVLEHFVWQVKRKMHSLPVSYHLMPVFVGRTGSGKSQALERFLAPLDLLVESGVDFGIFADERNWHLFGEKYVFLFDEMSKARKADVESLKNTITAKEKSFRRLHTNTTNTVQQKATFIGASNDPVSSLIIDPTSARRFWEIRTKDKCDWDTINNVKMLEIWKSVDETQIKPAILDVWDRISEEQNKNVRAKSNPELWFEECADLSDDKQQTRASDLYDSFKDWEHTYDEKAKTPARFFYLRLAELPYVRRKKESDGNYYNVKIRKGAAPKGQIFAIKGGMQ